MYNDLHGFKTPFSKYHLHELESSGNQRKGPIWRNIWCHGVCPKARPPKVLEIYPFWSFCSVHGSQHRNATHLFAKVLTLDVQFQLFDNTNNDRDAH